MNGSRQAQEKVGDLVEHCLLSGGGFPPNPKGAADFPTECVAKVCKYTIFPAPSGLEGSV